MLTFRKIAREIGLNITVETPKIANSALNPVVKVTNLDSAARAAILALMSPSDSVLAAGASAISNKALTQDEALAVFRTMLTAVAEDAPDYSGKVMAA